jgi:hypothetical protein
MDTAYRKSLAFPKNFGTLWGTAGGRQWSETARMAGGEAGEDGHAV